MNSHSLKYFLVPFALTAIAVSSSFRYFTNHVRDFLPPELIHPEYAKLDEHKLLNEQTRTIEVGGRTFKIPLKYVEVLDKRGTHQNGLLLKVIWPDIQSFPDINSKDEYDRVWNERRFGNINLSPASGHPSIDQMMTNREHNSPEYRFVRQTNGLEEYTFYQKIKGSPELTLEVYMEKNATGAVVGFIDCRESFPGFAKYYPVCEQHFVDEGLHYVISYNQANFFADWRKQRQRAVAFVNGVEMKSGHE